MEKFSAGDKVRIAISAAASALVLLQSPGFAATTEIHVGDKLARFDLLKPGVHIYARYEIMPDGHREAIDIWTREISFETKDGQRLMHIHQQWDEAGKPLTLLQDAWFEPDTFRPLTQARTLVNNGVTTVAAYRFLPDKIVGDDSVAGNTKKDFVQPSPEPAFNWETDMELLQALPLAKDYAASIDFYDAGLKPPARYVYAVTGEDEIATADGGEFDCWIVSFTSHSDGKDYPLRVWLSKKTQIVIREETKMPDGSILVKTLLNPEA